MAKISPYGIYRAFNLAGTAALDGGKLYTYEAGTTTPKPTYTDASGNTANANPVVLDVNGSARIWLDVGGYKFVLTDKNDVEQFTEDNIDGGGAAGFASQVITTSTGITLTSTYQNAVIVCTQPVTLSLVSAGIAGYGYVAVIINRSSGNVTIAPDGSETINGASSYIVYPNGAANIHTNGIEWYVSADGQKEMQDDEFRILGSVDSTKKLAFEVDGLTTATTRTLTAQDKNGILPVIETANILIPATAAVPSSISLAEDTDNGTNTVTIIAPASVASDKVLTLPDATGTIISTADKASTSDVQTGTSDVTYITPAGLRAGALVLSSSRSLTGTSVVFGSIPSWAKRVTVTFSGLSTSGGAQPIIQIGPSGGVLTSGYSGGAFMSGGTLDYNVVNGFGLSANVSAAQVQSGTLVLVKTSANVWVATMVSGTSGANACVGGGTIDVGAALTQLRFYINGTATFDAGTAIVMWE